MTEISFNTYTGCGSIILFLQNSLNTILGIGKYLWDKALWKVFRQNKLRSESSCTIAILYGWKWRSSWRILLTERSDSPKADPCLDAERRGDCNIDARTASMFLGDLTGRGIPVHRFVALAVCLNVVTHETIDLRSGTWANGAKLKRYRNARCASRRAGKTLQ